MHLIEYDLDNNVDEDDPDDDLRRIFGETVLGRNDFCMYVKLMTTIVKDREDAYFEAMNP